MGPKLKKPPKNSFSFFLDDYVEEERKKGRNISKKIAAEECAPKWKRISPEEKEYYTELAKANKEREKVNMDNKFTSLGISYTEKQKEDMRAEEERARQDMEITDTIEQLTQSSLLTHLFYLGHVNYYCKTEEGAFIPAELAISEFNLQDGVRDTYHVLIDPGEIPTGYGFEAKHVSDEVHGIPQPPYEEGEKNYFSILTSVRGMLERGKLPNGKLPPIYTVENNINALTSVLKVITETQFDEDVILFRVYPLHKMFFCLKNRCAEMGDGFPLLSNAIAEIEKDRFQFTHGIACGFHKEDQERFQNCSRSVVIRFVYTICDHCCQYVDVQLEPGKHCQLYCDTSRKSTRGSVSGSNFSSRSSSRMGSDAGSEYGAPASTYASSLRSDRRSESASASALSYKEDRRPGSKASTYAEAMQPLQLPKTRSKAFHPVTNSDYSDMESCAGESCVSDRTLETDVYVKTEPSDMDEDMTPWPALGRGSKSRRPLTSVGKLSLPKGPKISAGRGKLIHDDDDSD